MVLACISHRTPAARPARRRSGFSLIEVTIASVFLLVITLGILPLFTRALISNHSGAESTDVANFARSRLEEFFQMPFTSPKLTLPAGAPEVVHNDYYSLTGEYWVEGPPPSGDKAAFLRSVRIRQFPIGALADGDLADAEAILGGGGNVGLKEITVQVIAGPRPGPFHTPAQYTVRMLKSQ